MTIYFSSFPVVCALDITGDDDLDGADGTHGLRIYKEIRKIRMELLTLDWMDIAKTF